MTRKREAPGGAARGGGRITTAGSQLSTPNYSTFQPIFKPYLSGPLDLAIAQIEHHRALARFHTEQADKHLKIKAALEAAAFGGNDGTNH